MGRYVFPPAILVSFAEAFQVIIWQDAGADLGDSPRGPWLDSLHAPFNTHFWPISLYQPNRIFMSPATRSGCKGRQTHTARLNTNNMPQTITLLPRCYGTSLSPQDMSRDPIYALTELFQIIAASEASFLEMVGTVLGESVIKAAQQTAAKQSDIRATLADLQRSLERHSTRVLSILDFLQHSDNLDLPRSTSEITSGALTLICRDFEQLLQGMQTQAKKCSQELQIFMSEISVGEARRGVDQSRRAHKFSVLAALYVPISFSCSLFGMNFLQFSDFTTGFRTWWAVTLPLFAASLLFLTWNSIAISKELRRIKKREFLTTLG